MHTTAFTRSRWTRRDRELARIVLLTPLMPTESDVSEWKERYLDALLRGSRRDAVEVTRAALAASLDVRRLYLDVLQPAQERLGELWHAGAIEVGTEHLGTAITQSVMSLLCPTILATPRVGRRVVAACVEGELHDLGLRVVSDFFELEGWDVSYLGANTPVPAIAETVRLSRAEVLALSATRPGSDALLREAISAVRRLPTGSQVRVLVGGRAIAPELARELGADASARDAAEAVHVAHALVGLPAPGVHPVVGVGLGAGTEDAMRWGPTDAGGPFMKLLGVHTWLVNLQRELARQRAESARHAAAKDELLGMLAHDLRNPLSVVLTYSEVLQRSDLTPEDRSGILADVRSSTDFMVGLVQEVLDLARLEEGRLTLRFERLDLLELLRAQVRLERVLAHAKGIELRLEDSGPLPAEADGPKLRQVFSNLISNAIKFSMSGTEVRISLRVEGGLAVVEVRDQGVGIAPGDVPKLFRPFSTLRHAGTAGERSTGLGLAIAQRIVRGHGGEITVETAPGEGSTFRATLLVGPRDGPRDGDVPPRRGVVDLPGNG